MKINLSILWLLMLSPFLRAQTTTLQVGGRTRTIFVYAPSGIPANRALVISMHGYNQDINYQKNQAKWELIADTAKFVVVYPAGENNSWDISGTKDTDFILAIIESMSTRFKIDRNRVYVTGFSMGGMMCYHTANKIADKIAAIGPVSGYLFGGQASSSRPMPILHVQGTADDVVHYEPYNNQEGILAYLQKWRTWNKCSSALTLIDPYPANKPSSNASWQSWGPCNKSAVALISLRGKGHWHSIDPAGVHTTIELWNFMKQYTLPVKLNPVQGPYKGVMQQIPGIVRATSFDEGGNGIAYFDDSPGSSVSPAVMMRTDEDVDIENCTDTGGGYNIGFAKAGEWLEYTVDVLNAGKYDLTLRIACNGSGRNMILSSDGKPVGNDIEIPDTGGWQTWQNVRVKNLNLPAGKQILRVTIGSVDYVNINYLEFSKSTVAGLNQNEDQHGFAIHPNPFENVMKLTYPTLFTFKITDLTGKILEDGVGEGEAWVGATLNTGIYLVQLTNGQTSQIIKVCKK